jgi:hypothetical protein
VWPDFEWIEAPDDWVPPAINQGTEERPVIAPVYLDLDTVGSSPNARKLDASVGRSPFECVDQKTKREKRPEEVLAFTELMKARGELQAKKYEADQIRAEAKSLKSEYLRIKAEQKAQAKEVENAPEVARLEAVAAEKEAKHIEEQAKPDKRSVTVKAQKKKVK